jgi:chromosome segregation ATPase
MGSFLSLVIEGTVVILLGVTVTYCIILDRRLQRLRADETSIRQTAVDLGLAADRAERAIEGLKASLTEREAALGDRLKAAEATSQGLAESIRAGDEVLARIGQAVASARMMIDEIEAQLEPLAQPEPQPQPSAPVQLRPAAETLAAAEAFAERFRRRFLDEAA